MRFYSFTNFYLSSIQQGIQPAHCIGDMFVKYSSLEKEGKAFDSSAVLWAWARNHKTMICLNGGHAASVEAIYRKLDELGTALGLPYDKFHEDHDSLCSMMTCCGIVVPERIYECAALLRSRERDAQTVMVSHPDDPLLFLHNSHELELASLINEFGLAK